MTDDGTIDGNDPMRPEDAPDEQTLLASVYVDGEATPDERALVETSPEALAEVDELGQVRTVLMATAPGASLSEREAHLAAALDVWERMSDLERAGEATPTDGVDAAAAAAVITPDSSAPTRRQRRTRRRETSGLGASQWLLGAAAALVLVAGVAAVVRGILREDANGGDQVAVVQDDADEAASEPREVEAAEAEEVTGGDVGDEPVLADDAIVFGDEESGESTDGGLFPAQTESVTDDIAATDDADVDDSLGPADVPAPPAEIDLVALETLDDLADYGFLAVRALEADPAAPAPTTDFDAEPVPGSCEAELGLETRLEDALFRGEQVNVGVDDATNQVIAYRDDCSVVASTELPDEPPAADEP